MPSRHLLTDVITYRWPWRLAILASSLLSAFSGLAAPWFQKEFVDRLTHSVGPLHLDWFATPTPWIVLAFVAMTFSQGFAQLTNYLGAREAIELQRLFSHRLYAKMLALRADTMSRRSLGEVVSVYATDVPGSTVFLDQTLPAGASTLFPLLLAPFALSAFFDTPLVGTFLLIIAIATLNTALAFRQSKFFYRFKQLAAERTGLVNEWVQNIRTLRILGWTAPFEESIFRKREVETANRVSMVTNGQVMNSVSTSVTFLLNILTLALLTVWSDKHLTAGEILAVLWIMGVFLTRPFRQMPWFFTFMFDAWTSMQRLQQFLATPNQLTAASVAPPASSPDAETALEIDNLRLTAGPLTLLEDVSLKVRAGEFVAIVGEVGSGKTLLLLSLLRETGASFGRYRLNGEDVSGWSDSQLRSHFSFVPQEGFIMSATLRDNVTFDYETPVTLNDSVKASLRAAQFDLDRERVERGLETEIGERGVNLSGGQRQRVSLARVHYDDGEILLLDDCLSAVDVDTEEKLLRDLLDGAWRGHTRLLVTHRLTVLDKVDRIFFFREGRLIREGTYAQLLAGSPEFRDFTVSVRRLDASTTTAVPLESATFPQDPPAAVTTLESQETD